MLAFKLTAQPYFVYFGLCLKDIFYCCLKLLSIRVQR